jgi:hypothetical protein
MMGKERVLTNLAEDRCPVTNGLPSKEKSRDFDFLVKRQFSPGKHAHRNRTVLLRGKAAGSGTEIPCGESIAYPRRS